MSESAAESLATTSEVVRDHARDVRSISESARDRARSARLKSIPTLRKARRLIYDRHGAVLAMTRGDELSKGEQLVGSDSLVKRNLALFERVIHRLFRAGMGIGDLQDSVTPEVAEKLRAVTAQLDGVVKELQQAALDDTRLPGREGSSGGDGGSTPEGHKSTR